MKILLICLTDKYFNTKLQNESSALYALHQNSIYPDCVSVISKDDEITFKKLLSGDENLVFVSGCSFATFDYSKVFESLNINLSAGGIYSGNRFMALLPKNFEPQEMEKVMEEMANYFALYHEKVVFKLFGIEQEKIEAVTDSISAKYPECYFHTKTVALDSKTVLVYDSKAPKVEVDKGIKEFLLTFKNNIYAEDDVSCETRLLELLKLRRLKLSTAESMTGGRIASKIVSVEGASNFFFEGLVTYNTQSKEIRLGVEHSIIASCGVVSSEVAFEMAKGLLQTQKVNTAISITGYADNPNNDPNVQGGLCYIGIGFQDGVEVYKYNFTGNRKEIIETATNCALFLMIKTITNV